MENFKMNLNSPIKQKIELSVSAMSEMNGQLVILLNKGKDYVEKGDTITLERVAYNPKDPFEGVILDLKIEDKDSLGNLYTTPIEGRKLEIKQIVHSQTKWNGEEMEEYGPYAMEFYSSHNVFEQDFGVSGVSFSMDLLDTNYNVLCEITDVSIPMASTMCAMTIDDCISLYSEEDTCGKSNSSLSTYLYSFIPKGARRNALLINEEISEDIVEKAKFAYIKGNPFYYGIESENLDDYGNKIKDCYFFSDPWWMEVESWSTNNSKKYVNNGDGECRLTIDDAFWKVNVGLSSVDNFSMGSEDFSGIDYIEDIEESVIPEIIDMERIKCVPSISNDELVDGIDFYLHFRRREMEGDSGRPYGETWHIKKENAAVTWWNGYTDSGETLNPDKMAEFIENSGKTADLLGYLNFSDDDVHYRKKKLSKSFLRLSYYTSTDSTEQKLMGYSTIFLDSTGLYGKYVKQNMLMEEKECTFANNIESAVFCEDNDTSGRLDTHIEVTNEFDTVRSSEGFNIYPFISDISKEQNAEMTIYMKVEFNHAGNGKTIPMILWPKEDDAYISLNINNFTDNLYIPITIKYINDRYIYTIPEVENKEKKRLEFILFEPKLDEV